MIVIMLGRARVDVPLRCTVCVTEISRLTRLFERSEVSAYFFPTRKIVELLRCIINARFNTTVDKRIPIFFFTISNLISRKTFGASFDFEYIVMFRTRPGR